MADIYKFTLILHVIFGLSGVMSAYASLMYLLKRNVNADRLHLCTGVSFVSYAISWILGGYYYVYYYGSEVKPIIKAGDYAWAHGLFTESKEHFFLLLPFISLLLYLIVHSNLEGIKKNSKEFLDIKSSVAFLAGVSFLIGTLTTLAGVIISGAHRV